MILQKLNSPLELNNPGCIRRLSSPFMGELAAEGSELKSFRSLRWAYRAMFLALHNFSVLYGSNTLESLMRRWMSMCGSDKPYFLGVVSKRLGLSPRRYIDTLDKDTMTAIVWSIARVETGVSPDLKSIEAGWELFVGGEMGEL